MYSKRIIFSIYCILEKSIYQVCVDLNQQILECTHLHTHYLIAQLTFSDVFNLYNRTFVQYQTLPYITHLLYGGVMYGWCWFYILQEEGLGFLPPIQHGRLLYGL